MVHVQTQLVTREPKYKHVTHVFVQSSHSPSIKPVTNVLEAPALIQALDCELKK